VFGARDKAQSSGVGRQTWVDVENGVKRKTDYTPAKKDGIMRALGWTLDSWDLILAGGDPKLASEPGSDLDPKLLESLEAQFAEFRKQLTSLESGLAAVLARLPPLPDQSESDPPAPPAS
jgi:hypothetical protein